MGARNPITPMLSNPIAARQQPGAPPMIDLVGNVTAARAAADRARRRAGGANKPASTAPAAAPRRLPPGVQTFAPGVFRAY